MSNFVSESSLKKLKHHLSFGHVQIITVRLFLKIFPKNQINNLQKLKKHAARIIFRKSVRDHAMPLYFIITDGSPLVAGSARIYHKIALVVYKYLNNLSTSYMSEFISRHIPSRALRSNNSNLIVTKTAKYKKLSERVKKLYFY